MGRLAAARTAFANGKAGRGIRAAIEGHADARLSALARASLTDGGLAAAIRSSLSRMRSSPREMTRKNEDPESEAFTQLLSVGGESENNAFFVTQRKKRHMDTTLPL